MSLQDIIDSIVIRSKEEIASNLHKRRKSYIDQNTEERAVVYHREKKYRQSLRSQMIEAYGGVCVNCKEKDSVVLVLDHKNNDAQIDRVLNGHKGGYRLYGKLRQLNWPKDNYQLLCHNCNFRKEYNRRENNAI